MKKENFVPSEMKIHFSCTRVKMFHIVEVGTNQADSQLRHPVTVSSGMQSDIVFGAEANGNGPRKSSQIRSTLPTPRLLLQAGLLQRAVLSIRRHVGASGK